MKWEKLGKSLEKSKVFVWFISILAISVSSFAQAMALYDIGNFYIRFFSVTQLISDAVAGFSLFMIVLMLSLTIISFNFILKLSKNIYLYIIIILLLLCTYFCFDNYQIQIIAILILMLVFFLLSRFLLYIKDKPDEQAINIVTSALIILIAIGFYYINTSIPQSFKNASFVYEKLKTDDCEIKYFNDKYIFVEMGKGDDKKIEVLKFDEFFEHPKD